MSSGRTIARNTGILVAGDVIAKIASLAFYVALARYLGNSEFGDFSFAVSLAVVLVTIAGFGLDSLLTREVARNQDEFHPMLWNAIVAKLGFGAAAVAGATAIALIGDYRGAVVATVAIIAVATLIELIGRSIGAALQGLEDMAPIAISGIVQRFSTAALAITAMALGAELVEVAALYLLGSLIALIYWGIALGRRGMRPKELGLSQGRMRALVSASVPIGLGVIFGTILYRVDSTLLSFLKDNDAVGLYGAAYRLLDSTLFISFFFVGALYPLLSRIGPDTSPSSTQVLELGLKLLSLALVPIGASFVLFASPLVDLIYGADYAQSAAAVRWLGGATFLYGIGYLAGSLLITQDRQGVLAWAVASVAVQNVILNLILVPPFSFEGAAAATAISQGTLALVSMYYAIKVTGAPPSILRIASGATVGLAGMVGVTLLLGASVGVLVIALVAYAGLAAGAERFLYPGDIRVAVASVFGESERAGTVLRALRLI